MSVEPETFTRETHEYGRLWPDGTFNKLGWEDERYARRQFEEQSYELKNVPASLRPIFGRRRVVTTTETYPAEACQEPTE
ncbi:hypothetical protein ACLKOZ_16940 [Arthrobacter sp. R4]|uniref:hypothetical protein n=1 Tax=Arthrobacter sp. R4 TaxID=644417 RepID=UPI003EDA627C